LARFEDLPDPLITAPAVRYDGINASRHEGEARWHPSGTLLLIEAGTAEIEVPISDLQFGETVADEQIFTRTSLPDFRLRLPHAVPDDLAHHLPKPETYGKWVDRLGLGRAAIAFGMALPGSQVLLFDGLVQQAETPEELAAVLAHEIGHVRERHVMSALLRQFGLSILLSGANSGVVDNVFGFASLGYSRLAEREADAAGRRLLAQANISPLGAADFFDRLSTDEEAAGGTAARLSKAEDKRKGSGRDCG